MELFKGCLYAPVGNIKNLTEKPRIVYTSSGDFVTINPSHYHNFKNPNNVFVVEQSQVGKYILEGVSKTRLFYFTDDKVGRGGTKVCMILSVEEKKIRLMPRGV